MMLWYLAFFTIASGVLLTRNSLLQQAQELAGIGSINQARRLLILPLLILGWLGARLVEQQISPFDLAAFGFVLTTLTLLLPKLRILMLPCAFLSVMAVLGGILLS
ncbi:hypothetical protein [Shewanella chilikensis]|uniref:hypothetical protein n=1 Tax=Shewanella chilikensis TaxID=558541 RepID=UPI001F3B1122|nr:hypothetical protein [Shewanella chilikensis]MCE9788962.1 hypothetical protein [Shewanella chilikensis]